MRKTGKQSRAGMWLAVVVLLAAASALSCGKQAGEEKPKKAAPGTVRSSLDEPVPIRDVITGAGYDIVSYQKFPSEEPGKKGRILLYRKKSSGGAIYFKKWDDHTGITWHWYFKDQVPDSASKIELNGDGLWDARVVMKGGNVLKLVQGLDFTMLAPLRSDLIALNAKATEPTDTSHILMYCFDGDSTTSWRALVEGEGAFIELDIPFGLQEGLLTVRTGDSEQPKDCEVYADGKKIDSFRLEARAGEQLVRISPMIKGAKKVKLVFKSSHGPQKAVSIAELALR